MTKRPYNYSILAERQCVKSLICLRQNPQVFQPAAHTQRPCYHEKPENEEIAEKLGLNRSFFATVELCTDLA